MEPDASERVKYGSLLKEEAGGLPIMVQHEALEAQGLTTQWQDAVGLVYSLPPALILQLDARIDELDMGRSGTRADECDGSDGSDDDEEDGVERERDRASERCATTVANQQTLLSQLQRGSGPRVLRNVARTDYSGLGS